MEPEIIKIVILGPESTGKSTLCSQLAENYNTLWCPEYAREYLEKLGKKYQYEDLLPIAKGQLELEDATSRDLINQMNAGLIRKKPPLLFVDTDMYVMKIWSEYVFGKCDPFILDQIAFRHYDYYLLCNIDLPWIADDLREYPDPEPRKQLFHIYKHHLENQSTPWSVISGDYQERLRLAMHTIDHFLKQGV